MAVTIVQVDSFTSEPFKGNPAGVSILPREPDEGWMQSVALEMNLSETAFLWPESEGYRLRWFTPAVEVPLCGHATLASAHVLWDKGYLGPHVTARFHTLSGLLTARREAGWIEMNFPAATPVAVERPEGLAEALECELIYVGRADFGLLVEVPSEDLVRRLDAGSPALMRSAGDGLIVTSRVAGSPYDFVSRVLAPGVGVPEDPVTGAAHCVLGPYWSAKLGKAELLAYQASRRGGEVRVRVDDDRVHLGGQAVTVMHCLLLPDPWGQE